VLIRPDHVVVARGDDVDPTEQTENLGRPAERASPPSR
jgi:hypothetical protein